MSSNPKQPRIYITPEAHSAYVEMCDGFGGWEKTKIASEAILHGLEVLKRMNMYLEVIEVEIKQKAQQEVLDALIKSQQEKS